MGRSAPLLNLAEAPETSWQAHGRCRTVDSEVFFPPSTFEHKPEREERERDAKAICMDCTVRIQCLDWALATREPHGVWGGHSEAERRQILAGKRQAS